MKIFAIMIVKNESDVIQSVLASARAWAHKIYVMDNGSSDGTWEIIQSMTDETIIPVKQDFRAFRDDMRAEIFERYRAEATDEDWWAFSLDADEFFKVQRYCSLRSQQRSSTPNGVGSLRF